jgi:ATP-binding protein involved in chromosome partitioning
MSIFPVSPKSPVVAHAVQRGLSLIPGIANIVAIGSGKGGVGKSTTAANLAIAMAHQGARVGLLDADIHGPSVPILMGLHGKPELVDGQHMRPLQAHGLKVMSMGFLIPSEQAVVWRGPMLAQGLDQLLRQTNWGELDYLVVDMPPGTGDIPLTLAQRVPLTGAVIVTTPQDLSVADARRAANMFEKVGVRLLGLIENMAVHLCSQCGHADHLFGQGGGERLAQAAGVPLLGSLPLDAAIGIDADAGCPTVAAKPDGPIAALYKQVAQALMAQVAALPKDYSHKLPPVVTG